MVLPFKVYHLVGEFSIVVFPVTEIEDQKVGAMIEFDQFLNIVYGVSEVRFEAGGRESHGDDSVSDIREIEV